MKRAFIINVSAFLVLMFVPLIAELVTAKPDYVPGTGFSILIYEPFDFAYLMFSFSIFFMLNIYLCRSSSKFRILAISSGITAVWFISTFLSVGQLHLSLGGKL